MGRRVGELNATLRLPLRRLLDRLVASLRGLFGVRSRIRRRQEQQRRIAHRPTTSFPEKVRSKPLKDRRPLLNTPADKVAARDQELRILEIAETLGRGTDFVRVDLHDTGGRVLFGEITNFPPSAHQNFDPPDSDDALSRSWTLSRICERP